MPKRILNILAVQASLDEQGLSQANLSQKIEVSRETVSKWMKGRALPRPGKLLDLAVCLGLDLDQLTTAESSENDPVIAFRKKGTTKITSDYVNQAQHMGRLLSRLTDYLPFDKIVAPLSLKDPNLDFDYLEAAAAKIRKKLEIGKTKPIDFSDLVGIFSDFQAVIVPVMWGEVKNHRNALHIYLPESTTTWVYLNLDSHAFDFLFWMAHELGHVLSPQLRGDEAEDFADAFAGALLFPRKRCEDLYEELSRKRTSQARIKSVVDWAEELGISPVTIDRRMKAFAVANEVTAFEFGNTIYQAAAKLNKSYHTVKESLISKDEASAEDYIRLSEEHFGTPFFDALREYVTESDASSAYIQTILDIPVSDAKAIWSSI